MLTEKVYSKAAWSWVSRRETKRVHFKCECIYFGDFVFEFWWLQLNLFINWNQVGKFFVSRTTKDGLSNLAKIKGKFFFYHRLIIYVELFLQYFASNLNHFELGMFKKCYLLALYQ